jgi:hypothetical protein
MSPLTQRIAKHCPNGVHTILVVGAANGGDLQNWRQLGSQHLVLTEAHPDLAAELSRRIDATRNEEVWSLAVTPSQQDDALLHVCNNPRYSSLQRAQELDIYFPSIKVTSEIRVSARAFHEAIQQSGAIESASSLLVLAAPGQSLDLIRAIAPEQLQVFEWIIVHASSVPLYERDDAEESLASLKAAGYENVQEGPDAIHPERIVLLRRNDTRVRLGQQDLRLKQLAKEHARLLAQHKAELDKAMAALAEEKKSAANWHAQIQALTQERDGQAKLANDRKAELDKAIAVQAEGEKLMADRYVQIQMLTRERDAQAKASVQQKAEMERSLQASSESNAALRAELAAVKQNVSLGLRLQTLREADLKELQGRYQSLLGQYEAQRGLLLQLNEKLSAASNYFHLLSSEANHDSGTGSGKHRTKRLANRKTSRNA